VATCLNRVPIKIRSIDSVNDEMEESRKLMQAKRNFGITNQRWNNAEQRKGCSWNVRGDVINSVMNPNPRHSEEQPEPRKPVWDG